ncbi:MAG: hypothetical protein ACI9TH_004649 [Kiritimatiellia bacterium]|jgi:hypothetical protein
MLLSCRKNPRTYVTVCLFGLCFGVVCQGESNRLGTASEPSQIAGNPDAEAISGDQIASSSGVLGAAPTEPVEAGPAEELSTAERVELLNKRLTEIDAQLEEHKVNGTMLVTKTRGLQASLQARYEAIKAEEEVRELQAYIAQMEQDLLVAREQLSKLMHSDDGYKAIVDEQLVYRRKLGEIRQSQIPLGQERSRIIGQIAALKRELSLKAQVQDLEPKAESKEKTE